MANTNTGATQKSAAFAACLFYAVVAFEFFYMASPFAAYFYGVYGPGLDLLSQNSMFALLTQFFLPHIVRETESAIVNLALPVGISLFLFGLVVFAIGAFQVYKSKLQKREEVSGLVYRYIRHPQYLALMVSGFGMVLIWPRYLVLFAYVILVFIYFALARAEERICITKFPGYATYFARTGMFLPRSWEAPFRIFALPRGWFGKVGVVLGIFAATNLVLFFAAYGLKNRAIDSLYGVFQKDLAVVSLAYLPQGRLDKVVHIALADPEVEKAIDAKTSGGKEVKVIGYLLPISLYVSEIPMHIPDGVRTGHRWPSDHDQTKYKVVCTSAVLRGGAQPEGRDIVRRSINKHPLIEVHVDLSSDSVSQRYSPPEKAFYDGMPVPLY